MRTVCVKRVSKALFIRTLCWNTLCIRYRLATFFTIWTQIVFCCVFWVGGGVGGGGLCVVYVWLRQTSVNENTTNLERVLHLCAGLTFFWRLHSHVEKRSHFWTCRKCVQTLTHTKNEWRSLGVLVKLSTNSDARPANYNALTKILFFIFCAVDVRDGIWDWAFKALTFFFKIIINVL